MRVQFWGVRGSIAVSGERFLKVGGNTTCVVFEHEGEHLVIDAGTGIKAFGDAQKGAPLNATLLFTHVHWDHIQGLPFFAPAFHPHSNVNMLGVSREGWHFKEILSLQMAPPTFPVGLEVLSGLKEVDDFTLNKPHSIGPFTVTGIDQHHPNGVVVYRVEAGGHSAVFATDVEHGGQEISDELITLCQGVDLLIHDAQYTEAEYAGESGPPRKGWGHCMWSEAVKVAERAGVKSLALFHHDPSRDDEGVFEIERRARERFEHCFAACEGMTIDLEHPMSDAR